MKTTLMIDDAVLRLAKQRAAAQATTVSELVNQSLRQYLRNRPATEGDRRPFSMPVYGKLSSHARAVSPAAMAELRDDGR